MPRKLSSKTPKIPLRLQRLLWESEESESTFGDPKNPEVVVIPKSVLAHLLVPHRRKLFRMIFVDLLRELLSCQPPSETITGKALKRVAWEAMVTEQIMRDVEYQGVSAVRDIIRREQDRMVNNPSDF